MSDKTYRFVFAGAYEVVASSAEEARSKYANAELMGDDSTWEYDLDMQILEDDDDE